MCKPGDLLKQRTQSICKYGALLFAWEIGRGSCMLPRLAFHGRKAGKIHAPNGAQKKRRIPMKKLLSLILALTMVLSLSLLTGCGDAAEDDGAAAVTVANGDVVGEGAVSFPFTIVDKDGNEITITVNTDEEMVGAALQALGIIEGEEGDYGLYVKAVNGITADYEVDGTYWAFYVNGEYGMTGIDLTPITEGETYMMKVE